MKDAAFTIEQREHEVYGATESHVYTCPRCGFTASATTFERVAGFAGQHAQTCKVMDCDCGAAHNPWTMGCFEAAREGM